MARDARPKVMTSVSLALLFTCSIYTYLSFISISYYGQENIKPSIFENIKEEAGIPSILLRCLFLMIFFCNIPFIFFAGKIALMSIVHQCCFNKKGQDPNSHPADDEGFFREEETGETTPGGTPTPQNADTSFAGYSTSFISVSVIGEVKPEDELPTWVYLTVCFSYLAVVSCAAIFIGLFVYFLGRVYS